ncbi:hypothetical protein MPH_10304 [Macrophomina phaseolina MS6]|uniref:Uncharacterized protein n=1 Tax=Macrophomina phaseolina (strain MS6) TaxID=1126212 RepID=K2RQX1_MACPH|nr:hypothetical protein MPH_10304 [Macrophomina phaseolina MS6]
MTRWQTLTLMSGPCLWETTRTGLADSIYSILTLLNRTVALLEADFSQFPRNLHATPTRMFPSQFQHLIPQLRLKTYPGSTTLLILNGPPTSRWSLLRPSLCQQMNLLVARPMLPLLLPNRTLSRRGGTLLHERKPRANLQAQQTVMSTRPCYPRTGITRGRSPSTIRSILGTASTPLPWD